MNNKIVVTIAGIVIVGGLVWYLTTKPSSPANTQTKSETENSKAVEEETSGESSFKELMTLGKSQECEISFNQDEKTKSEGKVYLMGGKMRGDFSSQVEGKTMAIHMISMDETAYTWFDGMTTGFKTKQTAQATSSTQSKSTDVNQRVKYSCKAWNSDSAKFSLPMGISFSESMMQAPSGGSSAGASAGASGSATLKTQQCAACDSVPEESRAQCKAALGC